MKLLTKMVSSHDRPSNSFAVPLTKIAHGYAQSFYQEQSDLEKGKQIYLTTLAVYAVDYYLKCFGITTNLKGSDSWNPIVRNLSNSGDLLVPNKGKLECCPVWSDTRIVPINTEALTDRIGYVAVWLNSDLTEAILLGFSQALNGDKLRLERLQTIVDLIPYIDSLSPELQTVSSQGLLAKIRSMLDLSWENIEPLLTPSEAELAFGYRSYVGETNIGYVATDVINLQEELVDSKLKLNMAVIPQSESGKVDLLAELVGEYLPVGLRLTARETNGKIIVSEVSESGDTSICLELTRDWEESFNLIVSLGNFNYIKEWKGKSGLGEM